MGPGRTQLPEPCFIICLDPPVGRCGSLRSIRWYRRNSQPERAIAAHTTIRATGETYTVTLAGLIPPKRLPTVHVVSGFPTDLERYCYREADDGLSIRRTLVKAVHVIRRIVCFIADEFP